MLGNFHMINFRVEKIFIGMATPYHVNVNSAHAFFCKIKFS